MKKKDISTLAKIYVLAFRGVGEKWTRKSASVLLKYWLRKQPDLSLVAEYNGKLAGAFVAGVKPWWNGNHLFDGEIFVHPKYQKIGIGTELMKVMFKKAIKKYNIGKWYTFTFKNDFPLKWYKSLGFRETDRWIIIAGDARKTLKKLKK